jgi:hypothetical protein
VTVALVIEVVFAYANLSRELAIAVAVPMTVTPDASCGDLAVKRLSGGGSEAARAAVAWLVTSPSRAASPEP